MIIRIKYYLFFLIVFLFISCDKEKNTGTTDGNPKITIDKSVNYGILYNLASKIDSQKFGGAVHSLIIAKNDSVIFERYFNGDSGLKQPIYSVTKSFISALIGICLQKGYIDNIDMKVLDFFPEYHNNIANYDSSKEDITIRHLLTMTAGFCWNEGYTSYDNPDNDLNKLFLSQSLDWIKYVLDRPMCSPPGTSPAYNSGVTNILAGIIAKATGKSAKDFAEDNLFKYLGFQDWSWDNTPNGITIGGWGLSLRPIDMIKLGRLYLKKGRWNNVQVIPESWVEESIEPHFPMNHWHDYGYQWWRYGKTKLELYNVDVSTDIYFALGRGEQYIWVIPKYNAVVACTAGIDVGTSLEPLLFQYVLKAFNN